MKIAVTCPTGNIGRKLVKNLLGEYKNELLLLARKPEKLKEEQSRGATVVKGDLEDADYFKNATTGVDSLFLLIPPKLTTNDVRKYYRSIAKNAIDSVNENNINRVVFVSSIGAHLHEGTGVILALHDVEADLREAVHNLTILRPAFFMENIQRSLPGIQQTGNLFVPIDGAVKFPMIATADVAKAAAKALNDTAATGLKVIPLHGDRDYSFNEIASIISKATGQDIKYVRVTRDQAVDSLKGAGVSEHIANLFTDMYEGIEAGHLRAEIPRSQATTTGTSFEDFTKYVLVPAMGSAPVSK